MDDLHRAGAVGERAPLVSVIVPAFNHEQWITECLDSVVNEGYPNLEIVIIDDGSTDGTWPAIEAWVAAQSGGLRARIRASTRPNVGLSATLNEAIELSRGTYVAPLASDDRLRPGGIAARLTLLEAGSRIEGVFGDAEVIDASGAMVHPSALFDLYRASRSRLLNAPTAEIIANFSIPGPVLLARRSAFDRIGGYPAGVVVEDWYLYLALASGGGVRFLDRPVAAYRLHATNASRDPSRRRRELADQITTIHALRGGFARPERWLLSLMGLAARVEVWLGSRPTLARVASAAIRVVTRMLSVPIAARPRGGSR